MLSKEVERIANIVRNYLLENQIEWGDDLCGACGYASWLSIGIKTDLHKGVFKENSYWMSHCWVVINDSTIVDITASQFLSLKNETVYICDVKSKIYYSHHTNEKAEKLFIKHWNPCPVNYNILNYIKSTI